ncbi:MAG: phenylalanine--tRNA ligase subunit alpha [Candidatus Paceibacterota bacterium]
MEKEQNAGQTGHFHPITEMLRKSVEIFSGIGFEVADGPELEDEFHNFNALNIPADHPARDMQDTFWIKTRNHAEQTQKNAENAPHSSASVQRRSALLRTHTSSVQVRYMETHKPPFKIIAPGKVFRNEATDATHEAQFHQIEGLYVDKEVSLADLKGVLEYYFKKMFGPDSEIRFRPSYFSFVEPGIEVDIKFKGKWLEVLGAGIVHPNVLKAVGIDPKIWKGYAFGFGFDRLPMVKYGIDDIRLFYQGDLRLVNQF